MVDEDGEADGAEVVPAAGAVHDPHDGDSQGEGLQAKREGDVGLENHSIMQVET